MSIQDAFKLILEYLEKHDSITLPNDNKRLNWDSIKDSSSEEEQEAALVCALDRLVQEEVLLKHKKDSKGKETTTWVLINSQKNKPTTIELTSEDAQNLCKLVNSYLPILGSDVTVTPKTLDNTSVVLLLDICKYMAGELDKTSKELESLNGNKKPKNED